MTTDKEYLFDVLVIGSGAAGLTLALDLAPSAKVAVLSKHVLREGSTFYAQGGIAAVFSEEDTVDSHVKDTMIAGGGLCDEKAVRFVAERARAAIERLQDYGVGFTTETDTKGRKILHLTREGGHSQRRVVHAADATGMAVETALEDKARHAGHIRLFENYVAIDLIREGKNGRCVGAYALDRQGDHVHLFKSRKVVLATGGASKAYLYTSNPDSCTGDGIAMAWRAGARVANMEFCQFHPTCLYHPKAKSFLVTEAVRGEGGHLLLHPGGERFMKRFHPMEELAPRDVVARAIDHEMKRLGLDNVWLDISHQPADFIKEHFPTVYMKCLEFGLDMTVEPIPVVPAAHYTCGGVMTDLNGRTDIPGLYAVGEVAYTGLHGANRMASNSLLECLVFGSAAAKDILSRLAATPEPPALPAWDESWVTDSDEEVVVSHNWDELRLFMWDYVGIVRSTKRLERAKRRVDLLLGEIADYYGSFKVRNDLLEMRNLAVVSDLIIRSAMARKESRGLHYTLDYPEADKTKQPSPTILTPENFRPAP
ncbi:quinolinate synthase, L-aspartate oxidase (B protein) subunit [Rhodospirillaceae bacterium LM-1]|nr:quinolinate synthase, L-aspartate oxidase (B protein) subunit [Rhodospirillaceae bacterium LM-1]